MKNWIRNNALILGILIVPFVVLALLWSEIPETVPVHWNGSGVADDFASKLPGMLYMPLTAIFVQAIFWIVPLIDPKNRMEEFKKTIHTLQVVFGVLFLALFGLILVSVLGLITNTTAYILPAVTLSLAVMGNYFTRLRPNYFIGIRTPWTLESEDNWRKTHRLGGRVWMVVSLLLLVLSFVIKPEDFLLIFLPGVLLMAFIPIVYSYWLFRKGIGKEVS